ncbi:hypothetical protein BCR36DRAFT_355984 [Piromyces finnis]|uniref:C2H2-type domain-containing protein n=1 Tax=Piromyces finnis TaxID=1754191 RepID=A0A1Y1V654_9FUNG|nr:hypothetical protein BCR36DRAFT_355984 [Piromyces finnis]|eukprot:ORX47343.1 hypothetical protein BCR36DRAFT_355984 [Piromyces finnis]
MSSIPVLPAFPSLMFQQNESSKTQYVSKPFKCMTCLRSFRRMEHLNRHILTHTGERPFKCEVEGCGRCFSRQDTLLRHLKIHNKPNDKKKKKQVKKTQKKKTKNLVKRKLTSEVPETKIKKQKFDSIIISAEPDKTHNTTSSLSLTLLNSNNSNNSNNHNNNNNNNNSVNIKNNNIDLDNQSPCKETNKISLNNDKLKNNKNKYMKSIKSSTFMENKSILISSINDTVNFFDTNQSPSSMYNNFDKKPLIPDYSNMNTLYHEKMISNIKDEFQLNKNNDISNNAPNEYKNSNKALSNSSNINCYSFYNNPLIVDIHSTTSSPVNSISSLNKDKESSDHNNSMLLSSLSTLPSTSTSLLVDNSSTGSVLIPVSLPLNTNSSNINSNKFYSSITLPNDISNDISKEESFSKPLLMNKSTPNFKDILPSSSLLLTSVPDSHELEEKDSIDSINPLDDYYSTYSSFLSTSSSTDILDIPKIRIEKDKNNNNNIYQSMKIDMNLSSSSSQYSSLITDKITIKEKKTEVNSDAVDTIESSSYILPMDNDTNKINSNLDTSSYIPIKNVSSSIVKNDEHTDPQSSVSNSYLTPPLSPSLPTSTFVESQEQTYSGHKIYPCGFDIPCIDNCNCDECIANMPVSNILKVYTESIKEEDKNYNTSSSPTISNLNISMNAIDLNSSPKQSFSYGSLGEENNNNDIKKCEHCHYNSNDIHGCGYCHRHGYNDDEYQCYSNHDISNNKISEKKERLKQNHKQENSNNLIPCTVDKKMNYGEGDVIIEVGCSNFNCPKMDCPRRKFRPIASVCDGKICSACNTDELLNEEPCCDYNPLYHLIAAAEIASRKIDTESSIDYVNNSKIDPSNKKLKTSCCSYTDIENCHLALSSPPIINSSSFSSIKNHNNSSESKTKINEQHLNKKSKLSQVTTISSESSSNSDVSSESIENKNKSYLIENIDDDKHQSFKGIYIREDYNPNETSTTTIYGGINYSDMLAQRMKIEAEHKKKLKNIEEYEAFKSSLISSTSVVPSSSSSLNSNPLTASSPVSINSQILRNNKLSWIPAPIHSQLEPTINPILLKPNIYDNVNLSATSKSKEPSDPVDVDSCQVSILDKKQAIEQAIRCSQCPHSDRCYKRIRIEQLLN